MFKGIAADMGNNSSVLEEDGFGKKKTWGTVVGWQEGRQGEGGWNRGWRQNVVTLSVCQ